MPNSPMRKLVLSTSVELETGGLGEALEMLEALSRQIGCRAEIEHSFDEGSSTTVRLTPPDRPDRPFFSITIQNGDVDFQVDWEGVLDSGHVAKLRALL